MYCKIHKKYYDPKHGCEICRPLTKEERTEYLTHQKCPKCGLSNIVKCGFQIKRGGKVQRYVCKDCGHTFC